jgi:hypothetical protein
MTVLKIMRTGSDPSPSSSPKSKNWLFHENPGSSLRKFKNQEQRGSARLKYL